MSAFSLTLFSTKPDFIRECVSAGVDEVIVDWERIGKVERQAGVDTEVRRDTLEDLQRVRAATTAVVLCRINRYGPTTQREIEQAIAARADQILLPMVTSVEEVEAVLQLCHGHCGVGILVETISALEIADALGSLPLSRVYVGLNDLAIQRQKSCIFTALVDGTLDRIRAKFPMPFGFGGLTLPDRGHPMPCRLLIGEMARLDASFSFLRRSFHRDIATREPAVEIPRILEALRLAHERTPEEITADRHELEVAVQVLMQRDALAGAG